MSGRTEHSVWSPDEVDSLENIDKEIQLVSTSTDSHSISNQSGSGGHKKLISELSLKSKADSGQSNVNIYHSKSFDNLQAIKCGDFSLKEKEMELSFKQSKKVTEDKSNYFLNNFSIPKASTHLNEQPNSNSTPRPKETPTKNIVELEIGSKEDYLEQINRQLTKELDEKNAILSLLQENYERLLFKYAEAQNRIDELRIKFLAEKPEPQNFPTQNEILNNHIQNYYNEEYSKNQEIKCQNPVVIPPYINLEESHSPPHDNFYPAMPRPSSLPLDNNLKFVERELLKATTPTDSEGLSSIITSMSGHSKILNSLDEENQLNKKPNYFKFKRNDFSLQENPVNDPFDKVKNWQNSLPPLEQIETPETTLYNINNAYSSTDTNYKEIPSPKMENIFSDESCPASWREEPCTYKPRSEVKRNKTSSKKPQNYSSERNQLNEENLPVEEKPPSQNNLQSTSIIKRRQKRPPLLRCASLPAYDNDSVRSETCNNGIYIPPLDLNNVTLSDDESYCQQDNYVTKSNVATSSSLISSRENSLDRSIQTPQSANSCKVTISEEGIPKETMSKSTSITPDEGETMNYFFRNFIRECTYRCQGSPKGRCRICGILIFGTKATSCESVHKKDSLPRERPVRRPAPPFKRSMSFGSGTYSFRNCSHEKPRDCFSGLNEDTMENFDDYANDLKVRSDVVIQALTAHVNNS